MPPSPLRGAGGAREHGGGRGVMGLDVMGFGLVNAEGFSMPVLLGVILGVFITIAGAFVYDSSTGRAANGLSAASAGGNPPMVNWDVVSEHWHGLETGLRNAGADLQRGWKRVTS